MFERAISGRIEGFSVGVTQGALRQHQFRRKGFMIEIVLWFRPTMQSLLGRTVAVNVEVRNESSNQVWVATTKAQLAVIDPKVKP